MKKILPFCLLAIGLGFAQDSDSPPQIASEAPPTSSPSAPPASSPPQSTSSLSFDAVRGHAYNPYGIAGAPSSIYDLVLTPSDIYGKRFFYVSPTDKLGYVAFNLFGGSTLLGLSNNSDNIYDESNSTSLVLGYSTPAFGFALQYSIAKQWNKTTTDIPAVPGVSPGYTITNSGRVTFPGDNIGLYLSLPLGSATAYANANWHTYNLSYYAETEGSPVPQANSWTKVDYSYIDAKAGMLGSAGALNYDAYLNIHRYGGTMTSSDEDFSSMGDKVVTYDSYLHATLNLNLSYAALKNETARVLVGANNMLGAQFLDEVDAGESGYAGGNRIALVITPNILGEVILGDNWLAFAGAKHDIALIFGALYDDADARDDTYSEVTALQLPTEAFLGIRYQKNNWAFEAQVSDNVFNNPFGGFIGDNILVNFGGFIYF